MGLGLATFLGLIISALISVGATHVGNKWARDKETEYKQKADQNKITYSDVLKLVDDLTSKSKGLSTKKQNDIVNSINSIFNNSAYTSGLSESLMSKVKSKLNRVRSEITSHVERGNAFQAAADTQASALAGMSNEERAAGKIGDEWNLDTAAGRAGKAAEDYANAAKEEFDKAKALGEQYV